MLWPRLHCLEWEGDVRRAVFESGFALAAVVLSLLGLLEAWRYSGEGGLMPRGVMTLMLVLSGLWLAQSVSALRQADAPMLAPTSAQLRGALLLIVAGAALLFGMRFVGFYTSAAIIVPTLAWGLGYRNLKGLIIGTVLFVCVLIAVFRFLLVVPLPPEIILLPFGG
nr:tripartite tricarboxylate transporter TctB family protein [Nitratireductor aquimarinus]